MVTSSKLAVHGAFEIVQRKTLAPKPKPVTKEFPELGLAICPTPGIFVQMPVPTKGTLPARFVELLLLHTV